MKKKNITIAANWKMNPSTIVAAKKLFSSSRPSLRFLGRNTKVIIFPPSLFLGELSKRPGGVMLGAQDCFWETAGPYTGFISPAMIKSVGAKHVLLGHSERRAFGETDDQIAKKAATAIAAGLKPVICVGEEYRDDDGSFYETISAQLRTVLSLIPQKKMSDIVIVYEPVWAISTHGRGSVTSDVLHEMAVFLRRQLVATFGDASGRKTELWYGGSVNPDTIPAFLSVPDISGFLIGEASLDPASFNQIIRTVGTVSRK